MSILGKFRSMAAPAYIELKRPYLKDSHRLSVLKSKYNRIAVRLNAFYALLSKEEINEGYTQLKYYQQEIDTYEKN